MSKKTKPIHILLCYIIVVCLIVGVVPTTAFAKDTTQMTEATKPTKKIVEMVGAEKPQKQKTMQVTDVETQETKIVDIEEEEEEEEQQPTTEITTNNLAENIQPYDATQNVEDCDGKHNAADGWKELSTPTTFLTTGKYYLTSNLTGDITISSDAEVTLCLNEHTITGSGSGSVITVNGKLTLCDCSTTKAGTITGGSAEKGGGVFVGENATFTMMNGEITDNKAYGTSSSNSIGGGIFVGEGATFTMNSGTISKNIATYGNPLNIIEINGAGVGVSGGRFTMNGGTIMYNKIKESIGSNHNGGGVYITDGRFIMNDGEISHNTVIWGYGGGVYVDNSIFVINDGTITNNEVNSKDSQSDSVSAFSDGTVTMKSSKISYNKTTGLYGGGGVFVGKNATITMKSGKINNNVSMDNGKMSIYSGGGVSIGEGSTFTMEDGEISHNTSVNGGGVSIWEGGTFTMEDGEISYNEAGSAVADFSGGGSGGIKVDGTFIMNNGEISHNKAKGSFGGGGGVGVYGTFVMNNGEISHNETIGTHGGGGVSIGYYENNIFTMNGGKISNNTAKTNGGGISVRYYNAAFNATFNVSGNSIVTNNITTDENSTNNVYLPTGTIINVVGGLGKKANIGVTVEDEPMEDNRRKIAKGDNSYTIPYGEETKFKSDNPKYKTIFYDDEVYLGKRPDDEKIVTFDYQCDDIKNKEVTVNVNQTVSAPSPNPTREGYTLEDWYIDKDCTNGKEWDFNTPVTADITLFAKWTENEYDVTFNSQGGSHINPITVAKNNTITKPTDPTKKDCKFEGWYQNAACTGEKWNFDTDTVTADITLYAKWTENTTPPTPTTKYTVTFVVDGSTVSSQEVESGEKATKPTDPTKSGYTFDGWYQNENFTGEKWNFNTDTVTGNITLYAKWIANTTPPTPTTKHTVTFVVDGSTVSSQEVESDEKATEPTLTQDGFTLDGWYQNAACTGEKWDFSTEVTKNMTLYAKWTENNTEDPTPTTKYTVTFDSQGGSSIPSQEVEKDKQATKPTNPTRTGFTFNDWYTDKDCTQTYNFNTLVTKSFTLYAKWTENKTTPPVEPVDPVKPTQPTTKYYTVTFDSNGGTEIANQTVSYGRTATMPKNPTKNGYEFLGWFADKEFNEIYRFSTPVIKDTTIYAKWKSNGTAESYIVTFDSNGGSKITSQTIETGKTATMPKNPTKSGYEFLGWFADDNFDKVYRFSTPVTEDITIYAKWKSKSHSSGGGGGHYRTGTWVTEEPKTIQPTTQYEKIKQDCPRDETCPLWKFTDVDRWAWYHDGSHYCVEHNLIVGTTNITFSPHIPITRAMVVAILWRMEDKPIVNDVITFQDVKESEYYAEAVRWAAHNGIVSGYSSTVFAPDDSITREQMASILYRYTQYKNKDVNGRADISHYEDKNEISNYAIIAIQWACDAGIINGITTTTLSPKGTTTRAQAAQMFKEYLEEQ